MWITLIWVLCDPVPHVFEGKELRMFFGKKLTLEVTRA